MSDAGGTLSIAMSGRASSPVLVGRDEQMAALDGALDSVRQGGPAAVLLGGEAGVGKSRLISEFSAAARLAGARVLTGGCMQLGADGLPFAPFTAILRDLVHEMGADAFAAMLPGRATRELARLLPELGTPAAEGDSGTARARLFEEMLSALEQLSSRSPVVLIIEDAHWADRSSRDLLTFLIGNQRAIGGALVLVTYRSDELHRTHPLRPLLATLDRIDWVDRIDLPRFTRQETEDLTVRILGRRTDPGVVDALFRRTEGNPLFVETLLCCDGDVSGELPDSLRDLLLDSVQRLPEQTQEVLRAASAGGNVTGHALLAAVTGLDDAALTRALRPAVIANVLRAEADGYAFRHELIREAVHEDLLPGEHGRLHARFAEAIGADQMLVPPGRAAIEMAHHWNSAHDSTWALISAWQAAAQAGRAVAPAERLGLLARVLELWDQVPDAADRIGAQHVVVLEEATAAAHDAGEYERAVALASAALKELDPAAEPVRAGDLLRQRGQFRMKLGRADFAEDLDKALELVSAEVAPAARAQIMLDIARCDPDVSRDRSFAEEALALARQIGDPVVEANALLTLAMFEADAAAQQAGPDSDAIRQIAEGRAQAERVGAHELLLKAAINESHLLEGAGEHELAALAAGRGVAAAQEQGLLRTEGSVLAINQAEPLCALGRWDEATAVTELTLRLSPLPIRRAQLEVLNGQIALARGDLEAAGEAAAAARAALRGVLYEDQHQLPAAEFEITLALGSQGPAAGLSAAAQVMDSWELSGSSPRYAWPVVMAATSACLAAARQAVVARDERLGSDAAATADRLRTIAEKLYAFGNRQHAFQLTFTAAEETTARLLTGLAETGSGQTADLVPAWDLAAAAWEAVSEPYPLAKSLLHAAECAIADGDRETATERLRRAAVLTAGLGALPLSLDIAALARRARISLSEGVPAGEGAGPAAGLTERELEVLRLVAAGRSNRDIAAELFISPKTASVHVSNILGKLGAATRTEAAAKAHTLRLLD
jgi:DNA-binding CsgD family transcriptional regulator